MKHTIIASALALLATSAQAQDLREGFLAPPQQARPSTYWMWMNGNINKNGLTADLEYMKRAGYGAAMIFNTGVGIPRGPVDYGSAEWTDAVRHAMKEATRLGMRLAMHNAPGYSGTGGPWITPDCSMKQLVWADTIVVVKGKHRQVNLHRLPQPIVKQDYYEDVRTLAYPTTDGKVFRSLVKRITINGQAVSPRIFTDRSLASEYRLEKGDTLQIELTEAMPLNATTMFRGTRETPLDPHDGPRDYAPVMTLSCSQDGKDYVKVTDVRFPTLRAMDVAAQATFKETTARFIRLTSNRGANLAEIDFHHWNDLAEGDIIDITQSGTLPSAGTWAIVRIGCTTTGQTVGAAPDAGLGLECDKLDKAGLNAHFDRYLTPLLAQLKPWCGTTFEGLVIDSWEAGQQNWTAAMAEEFRKRRGYDLTPWLLVMTGRQVGTRAQTDNFRWDYKRTCADLFFANYVEPYRQRLHAYGLKLMGEAYGDGNFESLEYAARQDVPMSEFWTHYIYGSIATSMMASSAAHLWGKTVVGCECYTGTPFNSKFTEHPYGMKALGDYVMTRGVNRFVYHCTTHQPYAGQQPGNIMTMGPFGTHLDRMSTWRDAFAALSLYQSRCCYMLQQGRYVADVLYLKDEGITSGVTDYHMNGPQLPYGYRCDVASTEALLERVSAKDGCLVLSDGMTYRVLVVTGGTRKSAAVQDKIKQLQAAGVPVAFESQKGLVTYKGNICSMTDMLGALGVKPDFTFTAENADAQIFFIHRSVGDREVYFVTNHRRRKERLTLTMRVSGKRPTLWNAETGQTDTAVPFEDDGTMTRLNVDLPETGTLFIVFSDSDKGESIPIEAVQTVRKDTTAVTPGTFTLSLWAKPETFAAGGKGMLLYPAHGKDGAAGVGLAAGQNAVRVYERTDRMDCVLDAPTPLSGWTHLALVYRDGTPTLFINGALTATGRKSAHPCMPILDAPMEEQQISAGFEGDQTPMTVSAKALSAEEIRALYEAGVPQNVVDGQLLQSLDADWTVRFPAWSKAPAQLTLPRLESLSHHADFDVRHFSGTCTYTKTITLSSRDMQRIKGKRVVLDLGRVENIASVSVNGSDSTLLWKAPYQTDITRLLHKGENTLTVKVTNLYPNRIIGDEHLPERYDYDEYGRIRQLPSWYVNGETDHRDRVLFLPWKYYTKDSPLLDAGLLGPVRLMVMQEEVSRAPTYNFFDYLGK